MIGMTVVDSSYTSDRAGDVVEYAVDLVRCDVEAGHASSRGATQVMQDPALDLGLSRVLAGLPKLGAEKLHHVLVEPRLGLAET